MYLESLFGVPVVGVGSLAQGWYSYSTFSLKTFPKSISIDVARYDLFVSDQWSPN